MRKLLIVGGINDYPPDLDQFDEVWAINNAFKRFDPSRVNRVFYFDNASLIDPEFIDNINALPNARIITRWPEAKVPSSEAYPLDAIVRRFNFAYFTCSFAFCLAMACYEEWKDVTLAGCYHVEDSFEYMGHKPCVEHWLGRLMGMGGNVHIHGHAMLLRPHTWESEIYGYETNEFRRLFSDTLAGAYTACSIYPIQIHRAVPPDEIFRPKYVSNFEKLRAELPTVDEVLT